MKKRRVGLCPICKERRKIKATCGRARCKDLYHKWYMREIYWPKYKTY